jgi:hypothetical protein
LIAQTRTGEQNCCIVGVVVASWENLGWIVGKPEVRTAATLVLVSERLECECGSGTHFTYIIADCRSKSIALVWAFGRHFLQK